MNALTMRRAWQSMRKATSPGRLVTDGMVACPRAGADVDVDRCYGCAALRGLDVDGSGREWVHCRPARPAVLAQPSGR